MNRRIGIGWCQAIYWALVTGLVLWLSLSFCSPAPGQEYSYPLAVDLPEEHRVRFVNPDGSCVQCAIGMLGVHQNCPAAELLLWQSEYGRPVRGGSGPSRVRSYCNGRGIPAYNITGETMPWVEWSLRTGRGAAVMWGGNHMVTAVGISPDGSQVAVCDNNSPERIRWYSREQFERYHNGWVVILRLPPPPGEPVFYPWWK